METVRNVSQLPLLHAKRCSECHSRRGESDKQQVLLCVVGLYDFLCTSCPQFKDTLEVIQLLNLLDLSSNEPGVSFIMVTLLTHGTFNN